MKKLVFCLTLLVSMSGFSETKVSEYSNDDSCNVTVSVSNEEIVVNASKEFKNRTKEVQINIPLIRRARKDRTTIKGYCSTGFEYNSIETVEAGVLNAKCINRAAAVTMDIDNKDATLTYIDFVGGHYRPGRVIDDSFGCENLILSK